MLLKILGNVQKDSGKISRRFRRMLQMFRRIVKRISGNVNFHEIFLVFIKICYKTTKHLKKKLQTNSSEEISSPLLLTTKILSLIFIIDLFRSLFLFLLFGIKVFTVTRSRVSKNPK